MQDLCKLTKLYSEGSIPAAQMLDYGLIFSWETKSEYNASPRRDHRLGHPNSPPGKTTWLLDLHHHGQTLGECSVKTLGILGQGERQQELGSFAAYCLFEVSLVLPFCQALTGDEKCQIVI